MREPATPPIEGGGGRGACQPALSSLSFCDESKAVMEVFPDTCSISFSYLSKQFHGMRWFWCLLSPQSPAQDSAFTVWWGHGARGAACSLREASGSLGGAAALPEASRGRDVPLRGSCLQREPGSRGCRSGQSECGGDAWFPLTVVSSSTFAPPRPSRMRRCPRRPWSPAIQTLIPPTTSSPYGEAWGETLSELCIPNLSPASPAPHRSPAGAGRQSRLLRGSRWVPRTVG